jgi:hypothetical protein
LVLRGTKLLLPRAPLSLAGTACISQNLSATSVDVPTGHSPVFISLPALDCVCKDIGTHWKDLARNLSMREGDIDEIEEKYPRKLKERAYEVFSDLCSV